MNTSIVRSLAIAVTVALGGCAADTEPPDPPPGALPESCFDLLVADSSATDGDYTLYFDRRLDRPWTVYCHDMAAYPTEYLTLRSEDPEANVSRLRTFALDSGGYAAVETRYQRVRIDPRTLRVDIGDQTFAESAGRAEVQDGLDVDSMPFAVAAACTTSIDVTMAAETVVDLAGTGFRLDNTFCSRNASEALSGVVMAYEQTRVDLDVFTADSENCATISPEPCLASPYNATGGFQLQLAFTDGDAP